MPVGSQRLPVRRSPFARRDDLVAAVDRDSRQIQTWRSSQLGADFHSLCTSLRYDLYQRCEGVSTTILPAFKRTRVNVSATVDAEGVPTGGGAMDALRHP